MYILHIITTLIALYSANASAVTPIKESRTDEDILFLTSPGGVTTIQGQIDGATGNYGIGGSTDPNSALEIRGASATNDKVHIRFTNEISSQTFRIGGGITGVTNEGFSIFDVTDAISRLYIDTNGNLAIGSTTTPLSPLHILQYEANSSDDGIILDAAGSGSFRIYLDSTNLRMSKGGVEAIVIPTTGIVNFTQGIASPDLLKTSNTTTQDITVVSGDTLFRPNLTIDTGDTVTVNGVFNTVGDILGSGSLEGTGTVSNIDEQSVFSSDKTFEGSLKIKGNIDVDVSSGSLSGLLGSGDPALSITNLNNATGGTMLGGKYSRIENVVNYSFATTMNPTATRWDFTLDNFPFAMVSGQGSCAGVGSAQTGTNHTVCTVVDLTNTTAKVWCDDTDNNADPDNQTIYFTFQCEIQ